MPSLRHSLKLGSLSLAFMMATLPQPLLDPAPDFEGMKEKLLEELPPAVRDFSTAKPDLAFEIDHSFRYLRQKCPALGKVSAKDPWQLANWLNENITDEDLANTPYSFRRAALRAVAVQKNTKVKEHFLTRLQNHIAHDPNFIVWIDKGKEKFQAAYKTDPFLVAERKEWDGVSNNGDRLKAYVERVNEVFLSSFLEDGHKYRSRIDIAGEDPRWFGRHNSDTNAISIYLRPKGKSLDPDFVAEIIAHESFHTVEDILKKRYMDEKIPLPAHMKDAGEKYFYNSNIKLAYARNDQNDSLYKSTFVEKAAFYASDSLRRKSVNMLTRDPQWLASHPLSGNEFDNPGRGVIPHACFIK